MPNVPLVREMWEGPGAPRSKLQLVVFFGTLHMRGVIVCKHIGPGRQLLAHTIKHFAECANIKPFGRAGTRAGTSRTA